MSQTPWYDADPRPPLDWEEGMYRSEPRAGWRDEDSVRGYDLGHGAHRVGIRDRAYEDQKLPPQPQRPTRPRRSARPKRPARHGQPEGLERPEGPEPAEPRPGPLLSRIGALPGRFGVLVIIGSAAVGAVTTVVVGGQPGITLGLLIVTGTAVGGLIVRPRASHLIIPVPALAYIVAALLGGVINAKAAGETHAEMAVGALQWMAHGFVAMTSATILAIAIAGARWWVAARRGRRRG